VCRSDAVVSGIDVANDLAYPWLLALQALIGTGTVLAAGAIGAVLFSRRVGLIAAVVSALNPYAVVHGPSLQDTVVINFFCAAAILLLLAWWRSLRVWQVAVASTGLGLMVLTSARMLPLAALVCAWIAATHWRDRRVVVAVIAPAMLLVGAWHVRNAFVVGAPVLTTESGLSLWMGNHPDMLDIYPGRSIDELTDVAWASLEESTRHRLQALEHDPVARDRAYASLALESFTRRPIQTSLAALQKVLVSFGGWLSPARSWPIQLGYAALFIPLNVLALAGLWRARRAGPGHALVLIVFAAYVVTIAVFWGHTSHRSYVHIFKIVYAVSVIEPWLGAPLASWRFLRVSGGPAGPLGHAAQSAS